MQDAGLFEKWTLQGLLDELDTIELFECPEHGRLLGEVTKKQGEIYVVLGVNPPSLLISGMQIENLWGINFSLIPIPLQGKQANSPLFGGYLY